MKFLIQLLINAAVIYLGAMLLPGVEVASTWTAIVVAIVLGLLNTFVRPLLVILTIPITIVTLGLFLLVINALMIQCADYFISGFSVANFWWALIFGLLITIVNSFFKESKQKKRK